MMRPQRRMSDFDDEFGLKELIKKLRSSNDRAIRASAADC
jgi:hypothetical protein